MFRRFFNKPRRTETIEDSINKALASSGVDFKADEIYLLGQTVCHGDDMKMNVVKLVQDLDVEKLGSMDSIDVAHDIIQVYVIVDMNGRCRMLALLDPVELYDDPSLVSLSSPFECDLGALSLKGAIKRK